MSNHPTAVDPMTRLVRGLRAGRRARRRQSHQVVLPVGSKDFSAVPVCGSVRSLADQRQRRHLPT